MRRPALALALVLSTFAPAARAQTSPPRSPQVEEVHVHDHARRRSNDVAGSQYTIESPEIARAEAIDLSELLRRVPGLSTRQDTGGGLRLDLGVRGLDPGRSRRVLVLEDGVPIAVNPYAEPDLYYAPPVERVRSIEAIRGAGSVAYGPQTVGGVLHFRTLDPPDRPTAVVDVLGGQAGYSRVLASYGDRATANMAYVVQAFHKRQEGFRDEGLRSTDLLAKVRFATSARGNLVVKLGLHGDAARSDDVGLTPAMFAATPRRALLVPDDRVDLFRADVSLRHDVELSPALAYAGLAYVSVTSRDWRRQDRERAPRDGVAYAAILGDRRPGGAAIYIGEGASVAARDYQVVGFEPRLLARGKALGLTHRATTGLRLLVEGARLEDVRLASVNDAPRTGTTTSDERHRTLAIAGYIEDRLAVTEALEAQVLARVEHAAFSRRSLVARGGADGEGGTSSATAFVPGCGLAWGDEQTRAFVGLHVGYAPPRLTSTIAENGQSTATRAESSTQGELGFRVSPRRAIRLEATFFASKYGNQVVAAQGAAGAILVDGGATRSFGGEVSARISFREWTGPRVGLALGARAALLDARFVGGPNAGNGLPYAPSVAGGATIDLDHDVGLRAQLALAVVGNQWSDVRNTLVEDVTGREGRIPAFVNLDVSLRQRLGHGFSASLVVKNLLDEVYVQSRRPEGIWPAGYRQVLIGLRWDYEGSR